MRVGIFTNLTRDPDLHFTRECLEIIENNGAEAIVAGPVSEMLSKPLGNYADCDFILSLGGDGTFLAMTHLPGVEDVPMLGVNLGSVGFLPVIEPENLKADLTALIAGEGQIEERMRLFYQLYNEADEELASGLALNDVVVHRGSSRSILTVDLWINGDAVERVPGDGLIVATATGSTAYTLSAGGPIVHPSEQALIVTAICPHTLHNRSYLTGGESTIKVGLQIRSRAASLSADGREPISITPGDYITVRRAEKSLKMLRLGRNNFYETLAEKIQKRGISK